MKQRLLLFVLLFGALLPLAQADTYTIPDTNITLSYEVIDSEIKITGCNQDASGPLVIPEYIEGFPVVSIGFQAVSTCRSITSITLPAQLRIVEDEGFYGCENVSQMYLNDGLLHIGNSSFTWSKISSITIPDSVQYIGTAPFSNAAPLNQIILGNNPHFTLLGGVLYENSMERLIQAPTNGISGVYSIPEGVKEIGYGAFARCKNLTGIIFPDSLKTIGDHSFYGCDGITALQFNSGLQSIGAFAFPWSNLTEITIPASVDTVGEKAFSNCRDLSKVTFEGNALAIFGSEVFFDTAPGFTIHYPQNASGWSTPTWKGYPAQPYNTVPAAPGSVSGSRTENRVSLSWTASLPQGATQLRLERSANSRAWETLLPNAISQSTYNEVVAAGLSLKYRLLAVNETGSTPSAEKTISAWDGRPDPVSQLRISGTTLSWQDNSQVETAYRIRLEPTAGGSALDFDLEANRISFDLNNASIFDGRYTITVQARLGSLYSTAPTPLSFVRSGNPPPVDAPSAPTSSSLQITNLETGAATFSWSAAVGADGYEYGIWAGGNLAQLTTTSSRSVSVNLSPGENTWAVRAYNDGGSSSWSLASATWTPPVDPPQSPATVSLVITDPQAGTASLSWSTVSGATHYEYGRMENGSVNDFTESQNLSATVPLMEGSNTFAVRAVNQGGKSAWQSDSVTWTTEPALSATIGQASLTRLRDAVTLQWSYALSGENDDLSGIRVEIQRSSDGENTWDALQTLNHPAEQATDGQLPYGHSVSYRLRTTMGDGSETSIWVYPGELFIPQPNLINLSTRGHNVSGSDSMIAGFFIEASPREGVPVIVRLLGPTLAGLGVENASTDTAITLYNAAGEELATNDNWRQDNRASIVEENSLEPLDNEAALALVLEPGAYTCIGGGSTGAVLFEVYLLPDAPVSAKLSNISTRGMTYQDSPQIGGFVLGGDSDKRVVIRLLGPGLSQYGVPGFLESPVLSLFRSGESTPMIMLNGWQSHPEANTLQAQGYAPPHTSDVAFTTTLSPGAYTLVGQGGTGIVLSEVYTVE